MWSWLLGCASPAPAPAPPSRPNILVIDIDTLSAERVGAIRGGVSITPTLDALAARGVSFTQAHSQSGWTLPALTALLTGRYPQQVEAVGGQVSWRPDGARDLASILSLYDYDTAAFFGDTVPGPMTRGVQTGFARHHESGPGPRGADVDRWITEQAQEPFFALVHEIDLHVRDNAAPAGVVHRFAPGRPGCARGGHHQAWLRRRGDLGDGGAAEHVIAHYDGLLNWYDSVVAQHLDALAARGVADRTVVIVTSDHGEDLFVHAYGDHGILYDTVLQIPLIVADPRQDAPRTIDAPVQTIDLAPTILDLAGVPIDQTMEGRSLLPAMQGAPLPDRLPVFSLTNRSNASVRVDGLKLILRDSHSARLTTQGSGLRWTPQPARSAPEILALIDAAAQVTQTNRGSYAAAGLTGQPPVSETGGVRPDVTPAARTVELYDLMADPSELHNVLDDRPEAARRLAGMLGAWLAARERSRGAGPDPVSAAQRETLQDAGYWGFVKEETAPVSPRSRSDTAPDASPR